MGNQAFIPRDYDVFAGLDVDKKSISVTFTDHQGFLKSLNMPYKVEHLVNYVRKHYGDKKVVFAYEAGPTGYGLYDGLEAQAYPCLIASPSMIPKAPGQRVKTNRLDSRGISENLRGGQLKGIQPNYLGTCGLKSWAVDDRYPIRGTFFGCCASADAQSARSMALSANRMTFFLISLLPRLVLR